MLENIQQLKIASAPTTSSPTPSTSVDSAPIARSTSRTIPLAIAPQPHDARRASEEMTQVAVPGQPAAA